LHKLLDSPGDMALAGTFFQVLDGVVPKHTAESFLELGDAGQSQQRVMCFDSGLDIGLAESQMGQQEVSDQHEM